MNQLTKKNGEPELKSKLIYTKNHFQIGIKKQIGRLNYYELWC
jgi:hypothetical protein